MTFNRAVAILHEFAVQGECIYKRIIPETERQAVHKRIYRRDLVLRLFPRGDGTISMFTTDPLEGCLVPPDELADQLLEAWQVMVAAEKRIGGSEALTLPPIPKKTRRDSTFLGVSNLRPSQQLDVLEYLLGENNVVTSHGSWSVVLPDDVSVQKFVRALRLQKRTKSNLA